MALCILALIGCSGPKPSQVDQMPTPFNEAPAWSQQAIWYQIFVERFRNGDSSNDPTAADIVNGQSGTIPESWHVTPWTQDWYREEEYMADIPEEMDFYGKIQMRRYGGDLQGVLDKLDYLEALGVTAVYFNPLNDSPSLHKYNPTHWRHIDHTFGPDPKGDLKLMERETGDAPDTWQWTAADQMFLDIIKKLHERGIRVILDYSWNHVGHDFWAVEELRQKGKESKYADWFAIKTYDDPSTPENETEIEGWFGSRLMPVVKETLDDAEAKWPHEGNMTSESMKVHIFNITRRWLDPNADGDPSDGVDGFRLDVAAEVTLGFWRDYRKVVKDINPEAYLVGEIWWDEYPDQFMDPAPLMKGDIFDAVMNYRWYVLARGFFSQGVPVKKPSEFVSGWGELSKGLSKEGMRAMMNVTSSHDTPRLSTSLFNDTRYKYRAKLNENPEYKVHKPDAHTWKEVRMLLLHQFSFVGAPHIWNGDEMGMWGADDPDCRKPLWWDDYHFEPESAQAFGERSLPPDEVKTDNRLLAYYRKLIEIRKTNPVLVHGEVEFLLADDARMLLAYSRSNAHDEVIAVFNRSQMGHDVQVQAHGKRYVDLLSGEELRAEGEVITLRVAPLAGRWLKRMD